MIKSVIRRLIPTYRTFDELSRQNQLLSEKLDRLQSEMENLRKQEETTLFEVKCIGWQHLGRFLVATAAMETSRFIIDNMLKVPVFETKYDLLNHALDIIPPGGDRLYMEFGVYSGDTVNHIATKVKDKTVYGFDSFEGLPETWRSGFEKGVFDVQSKLPKVNENVTLVKGWFNESLPTFLEEHKEQCAFIHIDCDLYSSTMTVFEALKERILPGTVIVFDEYFNYPGWQEGEYKALQDFSEKYGIEFEYIGYTWLEQVAIKITKC